MKFTYEDLPIVGKEELRQGILKLFGRDIANVSSYFSSRNYAFIFPKGCFPAVIRVGKMINPKSTADVISEVMWVDDLKNDVPTVCQPEPSLRNHLVERIPAGDDIYLVTLFRKANGSPLKDKDWTDEHIYNAGVLLGKIHRTSSEGYERGLRYKRRSWENSIEYDFSSYDMLFSEQLKLNSQAIVDKIRSFPKDQRWYGMIHGDFTINNLFNDWDVIWVFDFDDSCYGYFMFDVATFICSMGSVANKIQEATPQKIEELFYGEKGIITQFKKGYTEQWELPEEQWALLDDFIRLRMVQASLLLIQMELFPDAVIKAMVNANDILLQPGDRVILRATKVYEYMQKLLPKEWLDAFFNR